MVAQWDDSITAQTGKQADILIVIAANTALMHIK